MKRFFRMLKLHIQVPVMRLLVMLISFGMGASLLFVILFLDADESWFPMGSLMALIGMLIFTVVNYLTYPREFMLALSMGRTRKEFMLSHALEQLLWAVLSYGLLLLLSWLESANRLILSPDAKPVISLLPILSDGRVILTAISALVLLEMFCGAMYGRFGKPFNVVLYVLWMSMVLSLSRLIHKVLPVLRNLTALWIALGVAGAAVMVFVTVHLGRKHGVR